MKTKDIKNYLQKKIDDSKKKIDDSKKNIENINKYIEENQYFIESIDNANIDFEMENFYIDKGIINIYLKDKIESLSKIEFNKFTYKLNYFEISKRINNINYILELNYVGYENGKQVITFSKNFKHIKMTKRCFNLFKEGMLDRVKERKLSYPTKKSNQNHFPDWAETIFIFS